MKNEKELRVDVLSGEQLVDLSRPLLPGQGHELKVLCLQCPADLSLFSLEYLAARMRHILQTPEKFRVVMIRLSLWRSSPFVGSRRSLFHESKNDGFPVLKKYKRRPREVCRITKLMMMLTSRNL